MMLDFPLIISGGNENATRYFPLCYRYIYSAGEPDRPVVICDLNAKTRKSQPDTERPIAMGSST
jgi:hypothetical protein